MHSVVWPKISTKAASKTRKLYCKARRTISVQKNYFESEMYHKLFIYTKH